MDPTATTRSGRRRRSLLSDNEDDDLTDLPFPKPLPRSAFTTADFSSSVFLTSLRNRHQSLEDLRLELRGRSSELEKELVELVNKNYADFIGIAGSLKGGEGKVKDLTAGVMAFGREVEALRSKIAKSQGDITKALGEKEDVLKKKKLARSLLGFYDQLGRLEGMLLITAGGANGTSSAGAKEAAAAAAAPLSSLLLFDEDDDGEGGDGGKKKKRKSAADGNSLTTMRRLEQVASAYQYLRFIMERLPVSHPFLLAQKARVEKVHKTILEDFTTALRECRDGSRSAAEKDDSETKKDYEVKLISVMKLWADLGEEHRVVKVLKEK